MLNIEIAPFDNLLVYKKGYTSEFIYNVIKERKLGGLRIFSILKDDRLDSIEFLEQFNFLEKLDITSSNDFDFSFLLKLPNLRRLSINVQGTTEINLSNLLNLEYLSIQYRKSIKGIENCKKLTSLCLIEFKEKDLFKIKDVNSLVELRIKTSSIETLEGIEQLINIEKLSLGNCKKLYYIEQLNNLINLNTLEFDSCPSIQDFNKLIALNKLQTLILNSCGNIQSVGFMQNFSSLAKLSMLGNTNIVDGNLLPLSNIKTLEHSHKKHYNVNLESKSYNENIKSNLNKIKSLFS